MPGSEILISKTAGKGESLCFKNSPLLIQSAEKGPHLGQESTDSYGRTA